MATPPKGSGKPPPKPAAKPPTLSPAAPPRIPTPSPTPLGVRPATRPPAIEAVRPAAAPTEITQLDALLAEMEAQDYFQVLKVQKGASPAEIKRAFYQGSRAYHPDRYYQLPDQALKEKINLVYKRMTEAYYVLRDDAKRTRYVAEIEGPERDKKLRFTEASETETKLAAKKQAEEEIGTTPKGRQFYAAGLAEIEAQRWSAAERSLKMAVTYEPSNARYKEKLAEAQQKIYEEMKQKGEAFKIK
jgi:hypothetical protein